MKSQNKNNRLAFNRSSIVELNSIEMNQINGGVVAEGSTILGGPTCSGCVCLPVLTKLPLTR